MKRCTWTYLYDMYLRKSTILVRANWSMNSINLYMVSNKALGNGTLSSLRLLDFFNPRLISTYSQKGS